MDTICYEAYKNLYINLTNRCSADCIFCIRNFADGVHGYDLRLSKEPSTEEVIQALERQDLSKYKEIVFTGLGEPTLRFDVVLAVTRWLKNQNTRVRLDTNGHAALINPEKNVILKLRLSISPIERSEKDSALQSRNSAEKDSVLPRRNSGGAIREAKLGWRNFGT